jgi:hypothetical protein
MREDDNGGYGKEETKKLKQQAKLQKKAAKGGF